MLSGQEIDCASYVENINGKDTIFGNEVIQLKKNKIPRGLVVLEIVFDNQDSSKVENKGPDDKDLEAVNLETRESPKNVYIGRKLSPKIRYALIGLLRKYRNVFAWLYDDLKAFREDLFQHEIHLKIDANLLGRNRDQSIPLLHPKCKKN